MMLTHDERDRMRAELWALPVQQALERVCVMIADPPRGCEGLLLEQAVKFVPGVGSTRAKRLLGGMRHNRMRASLHGLSDSEVELVTRTLWKEFGEPEGTVSG